MLLCPREFADQLPNRRALRARIFERGLDDRHLRGLLEQVERLAQFNHEVVLKYEIENFKDQPVTLDVVENLRHVRSEIRGDNGRDVEWELGKDTNFDGGPDKEKSTFEQLVFHVSLPARDKDGKAEKVVKKLDVTFKNEW